MTTGSIHAGDLPLTRRASDPPLVAIVVVGRLTGRILLAGARSLREATGTDLPLRVDAGRGGRDHSRPRPVPTDELLHRVVDAVQATVPADLPLVVAGDPRSVDRLWTDGRLLDRLVAAVPGHHEHTAPTILRSHALRALRRRHPVDHEVGRR